MSNARQIADVAPTLGRKNLLINGSLDIWQRGDTFIAPITGSFLADRFTASHDGSGGTRQITRVSFTPGIHATVPDMPELKYQLQYRLTSLPSGSTFSRIAQKIEGVRRAAGRSIVASLWARSSAAANDVLNIYAVQNFGSGGSPSSAVYISSAEGQQTVPNDNSWRRYVFTFAIPEISGKTLGTNGDDNLQILYHFGDSSKTIAIDVAGLQVEIGDTATDFEIPHIADEYERCLRYYRRYINDGDPPGIRIVGYASAASQSIVRGYTFGSPMRAAPAALKLGTWAAVNCGQPSVGSPSPVGFTVLVTTTAAGWTDSNPSTAGTGLTFDAEL